MSVHVVLQRISWKYRAQDKNTYIYKMLACFLGKIARNFHVDHSDVGQTRKKEKKMSAVTFYSLEEISKNTGNNGTRCWFIYKNIVYDVTDYLSEHPGGPELVTEWGGKESTKAFDDAGHSGDARNMLKPYKIGELAEEDRKQKNSKPVKSAKSPDAQVRRGFISVVTCGMCG